MIPRLSPDSLEGVVRFLLLRGPLFKVHVRQSSPTWETVAWLSRKPRRMRRQVIGAFIYANNYCSFVVTQPILRCFLNLVTW